MVSGLITSPEDQDLICSGDASEMRIALNSLTSSTLFPPPKRLDKLADTVQDWWTRSAEQSPFLAAFHSSNPEMLMPRSGTYEDEVSSAKRISCSFSLSTSTDRPSDCSSLMSTLKDSGTPGGWMSSPFTMASYVCTRPMTSSDFTVSSSWRMYAAPYASSAHTSISPKR